MARLAEAVLALPPDSVFVMSTGIIGHRLPMGELEAGIRAAAAALSPAGGGDAARAIMTTDLVPKEASLQVEIDGVPIWFGGIAKGTVVREVDRLDESVRDRFRREDMEVELPAFPFGSKVEVHQEFDGVRVEMPPAGINASFFVKLIGPVIFALIVFFWFFRPFLQQGRGSQSGMLYFIIFGLLFVGLPLLITFITSFFWM